MRDVEMFLAGQFNYFADIGPAKTDPTVELRMVKAAYSQPNNTFSFDELTRAVHDLVHVAKHYTVVDGSAA
jgi:hypothetical protein